MNLQDLKELTSGLTLTLPRSLRTPLNDFEDPRILSPREIKILRRMIAHGIHEVLAFCLMSGAQGAHVLDNKSILSAMRKLVAVTWLLHPELLRGEHGIMNLTDLAKILGCSRCALSLKAKSLTDKFKFRGRLQKRLGSKPHYAKAAVAGWQKRRAREAAKANGATQTAAPDA